MSLITKYDFGSVKGDFLEPADLCFYCGKQLESLPVVMWNGFGGQIWLHLECSQKLSIKLLRDFAEFKIGKEKADEVLRNLKKSYRSE